MKKVLGFLLTYLVFLLFMLTNVFASSQSGKTVYYITDNNNCSSISNQIISNCNLASNNFHLIDCSIDFMNEFNNNYNEIYNLNESYIIFEMTDDFTLNEYNQNEKFIDILYKLFKQFKNNGNYVMFISNTDEMLYKNHNDFLDYVDFHIITDTLTHFILNTVYYLEQNYSNPPQNVNILYNKDFIYETYGYQNFLHRFLIPYINTRYYTYLNLGNSMNETLRLNNINIYIPYNDSNSIYKNILDDYLVDFSTINDIGTLFSIGSSSSTFIESYDWLNFINFDFTDYLFYYDKYSFDIKNVNLNNISNVFSFDSNQVTPSLLSMIYGFIIDTNNDYSIYDNWDGRCEVTHMMINNGLNGWIHCFYGDETYNFLDVYNEESLIEIDGVVINYDQYDNSLS